MAMDLKGKQAEAFRDALTSAFPRKNDLKHMVQYQLDISLESEVGSDGPLKDVAFDLVNWALAKSRVDDLLHGALAQNSTNERLVRFAREVTLTSDVAPAGHLESIVIEGTPFASAAVWRAKMERSERCVARLEVASGGTWIGIGTGFLVAPDLVMTAFHVVRDLAAIGESWQANFDFAVDKNDVVQGGRTCRVASSTPVWESSIGALDTAILRLAERAGDDVLDASVGAKRGFLRPVAKVLTTSAPVFLLQHPNALRLKLGVGVITTMNSAPPRMWHTANTLPGSSGSPCFSLDWDPIALHHAGEMAHNRGIPFSAILPALAGKVVLGG